MAHSAHYIKLTNNTINSGIHVINRIPELLNREKGKTYYAKKNNNILLPIMLSVGMQYAVGSRLQPQNRELL